MDGVSSPINTDRPGVTWRSVLIGTLAVVAVCFLVPVNDFVLTDTSLAAGFLPLIAILVEFLLIVVFNALLHRFTGRHALSGKELAVVGMMTLVACSIPNWGLMRFFIPTPVAGANLATSDPPLWGIIQSMGLPTWMFPTALRDGSNYPSDPVVSWFYNRVPPGEAIPWTNWIGPLAAWGAFAAGMMLTLVCVGRLVLDQWLTNERLPFPLVQLHGALIEPPRPGLALNDTLRSPLMWIGLGVVFVVHSLNGLNAYFGPVVPRVPTGFDFKAILADTSLSTLKPDLQASTLSFMVIGATYFIRTKVALSVWSGFVLIGIIDLLRTQTGVSPNTASWGDAHIGACAAFILGMLWVGRAHWRRVVRNMFGVGDDKAYRITAWLGVLGLATMGGWLLLAGVQWWLGMLIVVFIVGAHVVVSRVVAETGLPFFRSSVATQQIYVNFPASTLSTRDVFFANHLNVLGIVSTRDSVMTFAQTGVGLTGTAGVDASERRRIGGLLLWTFVLGCAIAGATTLYCQYRFPTPPTRESIPARNYFGGIYIPKRDVYDTLNAHAAAIKPGAGNHFPAKPHNTWVWIGIGFAVTAVLEVGSKYSAAWPFLPVGFVASYGAFIGSAWFSIFLGWAAKSLIVRFGGSQLFLAVKPIFVGIILGEALAAAAFLLLNAILVANGYPSHNVNFLLGG